MWLGKWTGSFLGEWDGASSLPVGFISAALSGAGTLTGTANAVAYLASGLTGSGDLIGQLESAAFGPTDIAATLSGSGSVVGTLVDVNSGTALYWNYAHQRGRR